MTLDRIDSTKNYCPENCRWVNAKVQQNNRSNNHRIEINGEIHTIAEWAEIVGINKGTISSRIRSGWNDVDAVITPRKRLQKKEKMFVCRAKKPRGVSGHYGVSPTANNTWRAYIMVNKKQVWLGAYKSIEDAVLARLEAERRLTVN